MRSKTVVASRRQFLLAAAGSVLTAQGARAKIAAPPRTRPAIKPDDRQFLLDFEKRCFLYFWEQANPHTGIV
ncbi:MAG: hypothetical protein ACRD4O_10175, partial [Bryobacteraceae bacterium]